MLTHSNLCDLIGLNVSERLAEFDAELPAKRKSEFRLSGGARKEKLWKKMFSKTELTILQKALQRRKREAQVLDFRLKPFGVVLSTSQAT